MSNDLSASHYSLSCNFKNQNLPFADYRIFIKDNNFCLSKTEICRLQITEFSSKTTIFVFQKQKSAVCRLQNFHQRQQFLSFKNRNLPFADYRIFIKDNNFCLSKTKICSLRTKEFSSKTKIFVFQKQKSVVCGLQNFHQRQQFLSFKNRNLPFADYRIFIKDNNFCLSKTEICRLQITEFSSKTTIFVFQKQKSVVCGLQNFHQGQQFLSFKNRNLPFADYRIFIKDKNLHLSKTKICLLQITEFQLKKKIFVF